jgi:hypothetical protein
MRKNPFKLLAPLLCVGIFASTVQSEEDAFNFADHPHHFSVLLAKTEISGHGSGETIGLDYEYRLNPFLGLGAVVEYAGSSLDALTVLAVADLHITHHLIMQIGPGYERTSEHTLFVGRVGLLYEFELNHWTVSPQLHFDYHDGGDDAIVYGIATGFSF